MTAQRQWAVVIDGSNVAYEEQSEGGKPKIANIKLAIEAMRKQYGQIVVIVDATLRHHVDHPKELEKLLEDRTIRQAPANTPADYFVLQTADGLKADVLSNDTFRQYHEHWPWIEHRRIPYMIIDGRFTVYRPAQVESRVEQKRGEAAS